MENCRTYILKEAYKLFLSNNMEKVTVAAIEEATQRARGTIFHHFYNKQGLFESVVDDVFFPLFDIDFEIMETSRNAAFKDFMRVYKSPEERVINKIRTNFRVKEPEAGYYNFLNQAHRYYPSFKKKYSEIINKELSVWDTIIKKERSKKSDDFSDNESKKLAYIFMLLSTGFFYSKGHQESSKLDFTNLLNQLSHSIFIEEKGKKISYRDTKQQ